jgi:hypothetical protein
MIRAREKELHGDPGSTGKSGRLAKLRGRVWVTRRGVKVDRIASAWLVRRFVDSAARFRFVDLEKYSPRSGELRFDMAGGDFTHAGDRCTFETLLARIGRKDQGLAALAEVVHDIDLKDGKFARPETAGVRQLVQGIVAGHAEDEDRLTRGFALLDDLYASFRSPSPPGKRRRRPPKP